MPVNSNDPRAEQRDRIYAADLLNRAGIAFDARDLAVVAKLIPLLAFASYAGHYAAQSRVSWADWKRLLDAADKAGIIYEGTEG